MVATALVANPRMQQSLIGPLSLWERVRVRADVKRGADSKSALTAALVQTGEWEQAVVRQTSGPLSKIANQRPKIKNPSPQEGCPQA